MKGIIGVDEVGRGPVAGPLCVAALQLRIKNYKLRIKKTGLKLRDSKKLSQNDREEWAMQIRAWRSEGICNYACSYVHARAIDKIGISKSARLAVARSLLKIKAKKSQQILLDGSLYAPIEFTNQKTIIKGDEKEQVIALASIVAKVYRDKYMKKMSKKYPKYGFEDHVGYGTKKHVKAIKKHGFIPIHRRTFLTNF